jgi:hypothetical protein
MINDYQAPPRHMTRPEESAEKVLNIGQAHTVAKEALLGAQEGRLRTPRQVVAHHSPQ